MYDSEMARAHSSNQPLTNKSVTSYTNDLKTHIFVNSASSFLFDGNIYNPNIIFGLVSSSECQL